MDKRNQIAGVECLLWLMMNPDCKEKEFCEKWEKTRTTFYRMKRYIRDRLEGIVTIKNSEYKELLGYKHVIESLKHEGFDTVSFIKDELTRYKIYRLKVAKGELNETGL